MTQDDEPRRRTTMRGDMFYVEFRLISTLVFSCLLLGDIMYSISDFGDLLGGGGEREGCYTAALSNQHSAI